MCKGAALAYDDLFFDHVDSGAIRSARAFISALFPALSPQSVLDVGCGRGGWARVWRENGVNQVVGIDGDYVDRTTLQIEAESFIVIDLVHPFNLGEVFDLVQCLEVAEHIPESSARGLVESLCRHGDTILFSAATPGQGGTHHINEQPLEYWRALFATQGYRPFDFLRPRFEKNAQVEPWYRYNSLLYVKESAIVKLPEVIHQTGLASGEPIREFGSLAWRCRKMLVRMLPARFHDVAAKITLTLRGVLRRTN